MSSYRSPDEFTHKHYMYPNKETHVWVNTRGTRRELWEWNRPLSLFSENRVSPTRLASAIPFFASFSNLRRSIPKRVFNFTPQYSKTHFFPHADFGCSRYTIELIYCILLNEYGNTCVSIFALFLPLSVWRARLLDGSFISNRVFQTVVEIDRWSESYLLCQST